MNPADQNPTPPPRRELRPPSKSKPVETPAPAPAPNTPPPASGQHARGPKTWGKDDDWQADTSDANPKKFRLALPFAIAFFVLAAALLAWRLTTLRPAPLNLENYVLPDLTMGGGPDIKADGLFADARLADAIRKQLNLAPGTPLTPSRVKNLETLDARGCGTTSLLGIQSISNLQHIDLRENDFTSLRPLRELPYLTSVDLRDNPFTCSAQKLNLDLLKGKNVKIQSDCK